MKLLIYTILLVGLIFVSAGATIQDELQALRQQVNLQEERNQRFEMEMEEMKRNHDKLKRELDSMKGMVTKFECLFNSEF